MIYTTQTKKAMRLCFEAHKDQVDMAGLPYVYHPFHLAEQMLEEETTTAALLHDVVEDSEYTLADLNQMGFSKPVLDALALLTHDESIPYLDHVTKLKVNPVARAVKLADLRRLDEVDDNALRRVEKYKEAISLLES